MQDTNMPAAEAVVDNEREPVAYELAFHVLPTVAEGEVKNVFEDIKAAIKKAGGELKQEEVPARFDLAFDIVKFLEGKNRKFKSAYFGWVRFTLEPAKLSAVTEMVEGKKELLRHLLIRLSKVEEANPFYFHPAIASRVVENITIDAEDEVAEVVDEVTEEVIEDVQEKADAV